MKLTYTLSDEKALAALARAPGAMEKHLDAALERVAIEGANEMRAEAGKHDVFGTLKQSIGVRKTARLERFISPGVNYAIPVEEGTGPAVGKARYFPNPDNLMQFLRQSPRARGFSWARKNSRKRGEQDVELWFRSRALAYSIYMKGTQPTHFVANTAEKLKGRFFAGMDAGAQRGVDEVMA